MSTLVKRVVFLNLLCFICLVVTIALADIDNFYAFGAIDSQKIRRERLGRVLWLQLLMINLPPILRELLQCPIAV